MKYYKDKELNSMILFLRINKLAEIQYIDIDGQDKFYDYIRQSSLTRKEVIEYALDNDWKLLQVEKIKIKEILGLSRYNDWLTIEQGSIYSTNYEDMEKKAKELIKQWRKNE